METRTVVRLPQLYFRNLTLQALLLALNIFIPFITCAITLRYVSDIAFGIKMSKVNPF